MSTKHRSEPLDEFLWLEDIHGERALAWVTEQNTRTSKMLETPKFAETERQILEVLDSDDRIPMVSKFGPYFYNFWRDAEHPRGLWRRTTLESYRTSEPEWEILFDVDELGRKEEATWVWADARLLHPDYTRALVRLSPEGGDAIVVREFDLDAKAFVEDGFVLPVAKTESTWIDSETIFVATDFGPGTMTTSGYPRQAKRWSRGTPLDEADLVLEIHVDHTIVEVEHDHTVGFERDIARDVVDFFHTKSYLVDGETLTHIDVPADANLDLHREWLLIRPRSDWTPQSITFPAGSLLAVKFDDYLAGSRDLFTLFAPDEHTALSGWSWTRHYLLLTLLHDVSSRVDVLSPGDQGWLRVPLISAPELHSVSASGVDKDENDDFWLVTTGYLTPTTLQLGTAGTDTIENLKSSPSFFDASKYAVEQHFVTSKDGTRIPYFQIGPRGLELHGQDPTLLNGYGGFEVARTPEYNGHIGRAWLERGGVYVVANIRGGGEYGPAWHTAALKAKRHRAYEDFAAVAEDLIDRGVTCPQHLGCLGGSNGGLLVGNMLTHYPHLFGAIACLVPLLDMRRYTKLSAGASWIAEYGDPDDPEEWAFIQTFSPYHNLKTGVTYPPVLFYTATSDDRVGPVQARKMAARMQRMGFPDVWFYENREGGHGGAADNKQLAHLHAAAYEFLWDRLNDEVVEVDK
ncbi:MAG: prolyl oligopeptidase family serine peptidase [Thermomicrobiales bacterium]